MESHGPYDIAKLDDNAEWLDLPPADLVAAGSQFDNPPYRLPSRTTLANDILAGVSIGDGGRYPDPENKLPPTQYCYFTTPAEQPYDDALSSDLHHSLTTATLPSTASHGKGGGGSPEEMAKQTHTSGSHSESETVDDKWQVPTSLAARLAQGLLPLPRKRPAPERQDNQDNGVISLLASGPYAPPFPTQHDSVADWTQDQESAFHPLVGNLKLKVSRPSTPLEASGVSPSTTLVDEPVNGRWPCRHEGCKSKVEPFTTKKRRNKHEIIHYSSASCKRCHRKFEDQEALNHHLATSSRHSIGSEARKMCRLCRKTFKRPDGLTRHSKEAHEEQYELEREAKKRRTSSAMSSQTAVETAPHTPTTSGHAMLSPSTAPKAPRSKYDHQYQPPDSSFALRLPKAPFDPPIGPADAGHFPTRPSTHEQQPSH